MKVTTLTAAQQNEIAVLRAATKTAQAAFVSAHAALQTALHAVLGTKSKHPAAVQVSDDGQHIVS